jgi:hypothetical protein
MSDENDENNALMEVLEWVVDIDLAAIIASVAKERNQHPELTNKQLAGNAFSHARWKATSRAWSQDCLRIPGPPFPPRQRMSRSR